MSFDRSPESIKRNLNFDVQNERKRKSSSSSPCSSGSYESCFTDLDTMYSCSSSMEISFKEAIVSSPIENTRLNNELSASLERCCFIENNLKKARWEVSKSSSAPNTPPREHKLKRCGSYEFTPSKSLGTPERYEILYPSINEKPLPYKPSPLRNFRNLPARKRLFIGRDFVRLFKIDNNCSHLINNILSYLNGNDLVNFVKVSKLWKRAVRDDSKTYERYKYHKNLFMSTKENMSVDTKHTQLDVGKENKPSPVPKTQYEKHIKLANKIRGDQKITKCSNCGDPSILDRNGIAQCTKRSCGYIWCTKCLHGSDEGPEHFYCHCEKGNTPPPSLGDISNTSFRHYYDPEPSNAIDSGYLTNSDSSLSFNQDRRRSILSESNRSWNQTPNNSRRTPRSPDAATYSDIAKICKRQRILRSKDNDPSSPPRVKNNVIGSKKSKKSLRRLCS